MPKTDNEVIDFVNDWVTHNATATAYPEAEDKENVKFIAERLIEEAAKEEITRDRIEKLCGVPEDIVSEALHESVNSDVERAMSKDKS